MSQTPPGQANPTTAQHAAEAPVDIVAESAFQKLASITSSYLDTSSVERLRKAYLFAHSLHAGQLRKSGEP